VSDVYLAEGNLSMRQTN